MVHLDLVEVSVRRSGVFKLDAIVMVYSEELT